MKSKAIAVVIAENAALIAGLHEEQRKLQAAYGFTQLTKSK